MDLRETARRDAGSRNANGDLQRGERGKSLMHAFVHMSTMSDRAIPRIAWHGRTQVEPRSSNIRPGAIREWPSGPIAPMGSMVDRMYIGYVWYAPVVGLPVATNCARAARNLRNIRLFERALTWRHGGESNQKS